MGLATGRRGLLLVNLGSPASPTTGAARRYLREFLMDPYVIDMPAIARWPFVYGLIAPFRSPKTAAAYRQIWSPETGSPLVWHHAALTHEVQFALGDAWLVAGAMRYGSPSIAEAVESLAQGGVDEVMIAPLYPHFALATVATTVDACERALASRLPSVATSVLPPFYDDAGFIDAFAQQARPVIDAIAADHVLFSYHGLPVHQVRKTDQTGHRCFASPDCCATSGPGNERCYRRHTVVTSRLLATSLALDERKWSVSYQSRLGPVPWLRPYTDVVLGELATAGVRRLAVLCPAFVADNLETLEEVAIRGRATFLAAGGDDLRLVPSLNASDAWVGALADLVRGVPTLSTDAALS